MSSLDDLRSGTLALTEAFDVAEVFGVVAARGHLVDDPVRDAAVAGLAMRPGAQAHDDLQPGRVDEQRLGTLAVVQAAADPAADAAAIALCHVRSRRFKRLKVLDSFGGSK